MPQADSKMIGELVERIQKETSRHDVLDELVTDLKCGEASSVNNGGFAEQVAYIVAQLGADDARREIDSLLKGNDTACDDEE